ncbi:hypothetical protein [Azospirillum sp.]|uniref:hypothetical protein n=1 Tax=Azospirillum sp. TaxID=34012 RepID=UPI002D483CAD|nr:hypothetical protein [Azospirillum sp.]HYF89708.1 hypothetical protein [Azospirillum sp.]
MNADMRALDAGWNRPGGAPLRAALPDGITLDDIPALPLARAADMPAHAGFARGSLGVELAGLRLELADSAVSAQRSQDALGRDVLEVRIQDIRLRGRQTLQGTRIWESGLDGAGTGLPLNTRRRGGADQDAHPTWIATANEQRAALQNVPGGNGAALLSTYSNHRAAFNDVFTDPNGYAFQIGWGTPEISDMANDTNTALTATVPAGGSTGGSASGPVVNDPNKIYGTTTYNGNAQNQQLALMTTLAAMASFANPNNPTDPTNPYNQAAAATLTFSSSILGNTQTQKIADVPSMDKQGVYNLVQTGTPAQPHSVDDVHALLNGNPIGGRDSEGKSWTMCLGEDERAFVRRMQADIAEHIARLAAQKPVDLVSGQLEAELACYVYLQFGTREDGEPCLLDGRVELDGFDLDIDDGGWDAALGAGLAQDAREALGEARFVKSLLHDRIADTLERALVQPIAKAVLGSGS